MWMPLMRGNSPVTLAPAMRFWWVNQNQTFEQEFNGGYLWSPKRKQTGARNPFYDSMREVAPGDVVFSFCNQEIAAISVAQSYCYECPKPEEFGNIGPNWHPTAGWRVDVAYRTPYKRVRPKEHMKILGPLLPEKYSPLRSTGVGLQGVYLASVSRPFAEALAGLIGVEAQELVSAAEAPVALSPMVTGAARIEEWEDHLQEQLDRNSKIKETEKTALIRARRGQGIFKQNVMILEKACRITKVENHIHLIGSHIKPWRDSNNDERLDGENGLLLTPSIDHLFDQGFISFENNGRVLVSPVADPMSLNRMGVRTEEDINVGDFSSGQKRYLEFHRESVFKQTAH